MAGTMDLMTAATSPRINVPRRPILNANVATMRQVMHGDKNELLEIRVMTLSPVEIPIASRRGLWRSTPPRTPASYSYITKLVPQITFIGQSSLRPWRVMKGLMITRRRQNLGHPSRQRPQDFRAPLVEWCMHNSYMCRGLPKTWLARAFRQYGGQA